MIHLAHRMMALTRNSRQTKASLLTSISIIASLLVTVFIHSSRAGKHDYPDDFRCSLCVDFIQDVLIDGVEDPQSFCGRHDVCDYIRSTHEEALKFVFTHDGQKDLSLSAYRICTDHLNICTGEQHPDPLLFQASSSDLLDKYYSDMVITPTVNATNFRVSKAMGPRGYNYIRFSVIDDFKTPRPLQFTDFFNDGGYAAQFKYRWTNKYLYSKLIPVNTQYGTKIDLGDDFIVDFRLKPKGSPVRGILIADPCFTSEWVSCRYGSSYEILQTLTRALNIAADEPKGLDFWMILGDMFYDRYSGSADRFFQLISPRVRSIPFVSALGNHDIWIRGHPLLKTHADQFGNGFMQYFAQDTVAAMPTNSYTTGDSNSMGGHPRNSPFNFSNNPDKSFTIWHEKREIATLDNFISYHMIGNIGVFSYSGAHTWDLTKPYAKAACEYFAVENPDVVLLVSHWNEDSDGGYKDMTGEAMWNHFHNIEKCSLTMPIHFVVGHEHCNRVLSNGNGFMVGGQGMSGCGAFGIPLIETTSKGELLVLYYPFHDSSKSYPEVMQCLEAKGFEGCEHLAYTWYNATITEPVLPLFNEV